MKKLNLIVLIVLMVIAGIYIYQRWGRDDFGLPRGGESEVETILIQDGEVIGVGGDEVEGEVETKEIMITDGVKHSVPLEDIRGGGPPRDGIPPIDEPQFVSAAAASDWLEESEPGIAVEIDGVKRFYPFQILVWHEIVNDTFEGKRVLVTYCPLCLSGIVFDPLVNGERVEFGTSGKLWNSNLVMYDRKTESLWSQVLGEAVVGEMTGTKLAVLESDQMRFGEWQTLNPSGQVLSRDTGATRVYGSDPYGGYYTDNRAVYFPVDSTDDRLENKDFVLGIVINDQAKAYLPEAIKKIGRLEENFAGKDLVIEYVAEIDAVRIFAKMNDGSLERINPWPSFWFSWVAVHPETELFK